MILLVPCSKIGDGLLLVLVGRSEHDDCCRMAMLSVSVVRSLPAKGSSTVLALFSVAKEMPSASSLSYRMLLFGSILDDGRQ